MSILIDDKTVASIHYKLTNDDGEVVDSSEGRDPLEYLHGHGNIVAGLEKALDGKSEGDSVEVSVSPSEGYGEIEDELLDRVVPADGPRAVGRRGERRGALLGRQRRGPVGAWRPRRCRVADGAAAVERLADEPRVRRRRRRRDGGAGGVRR